MPEPADDLRSGTGHRTKSEIRRSLTELTRSAYINAGTTVHEGRVRRLVRHLMDVHGEPPWWVVEKAVTDDLRIDNRTGRTDADYMARMAEQHPGGRRTSRRKWQLGEAGWRTHD